MKNSLIILMFISITACSSIPLSTMLKISSMDQQDVLDINPREIRVRLTLDEPAKIDARNVKLVFEFEHQQNIHSEYQYRLKLLTNRSIPSISGIFNDTPAANQYEFRISNDSLSEFKQYQKDFIKNGKPKKYKWRVFYVINQKITPGLKLNMDVELKFSNKEEYFYLLENAELTVERL